MVERLATLVEHRYPISGSAFFIVECPSCGLVLNSGHHYMDKLRPHAEHIAAEHNRLWHRS